MQFPYNEDMEQDINLEDNFLYLKRQHFAIGYSDGVMAGKEYILQNSFNQSFINSAKWFQNIAIYRGVFSALLFQLQKRSCPINILTKLEDLLFKFEAFENSEIHLDFLKESLSKEISIKDVQPVTKPFDEVNIDIISESIKNLNNIDSLQPSYNNYKTEPTSILLDISSEGMCLTKEAELSRLKRNDIFLLMKCVFDELEPFLEIPQYNAVKEYLSIV
nr:uncharacterized protein LOC100205256 isoform X1 [Hydra vulgaris]XP_047136004.1 uncharacterized protein LOC100205256 isoform X1 [Hydra vulgaris]XP_047136005.1 uncharacterized protein LOC100205256 isoform X1 [Hydra vulgaris]